jgi:hypothetical protein
MKRTDAKAYSNGMTWEARIMRLFEFFKSKYVATAIGRIRLNDSQMSIEFHWILLTTWTGRRVIKRLKNNHGITSSHYSSCKAQVMAWKIGGPLPDLEYLSGNPIVYERPKKKFTQVGNVVQFRKND